MKKRVLVAPLDWGLGHATRCIPVISELLKHDCDVMVAGSGASLELLKKEFPVLIFFALPGYAPVYPKNEGMVFRMALQLPHFLKTIRTEHEEIQTIIRRHGIDVVISDNRYGCWSSNAVTVFITHQSNVLMPRRFGWLGRWVRTLNEKYMRRFDLCWIPDVPGEGSVAGDLIRFGTVAHPRTSFIGPLSRFRFTPALNSETDVLAICSGPEPQRSILEQRLLQELEKAALRYVLVRGVIEEGAPRYTHNGVVHNYLVSSEMEHLIKASRLVLARSGFSTVMDMMALGKKAVFIPTPEQTEQMYLAERMKDNGTAFFMEQHAFNLETALAESQKYRGFQPGFENEWLAGEIKNLLKADK
jgi:uncharacterized protein (TIGR00661 family)